ncbi:Uncharacterized protein CTYZ_00003166 [Cryptosporidium tyzzeri]|nr:Uncharacterized protein CTYZ_00003166 [Cryptosporidium tyzzeri]
MFIKNIILLLFIYFIFLFENITDNFLVKKEISLIKIRNVAPNEGSSSSSNSNSEGLSRGGGRGGKKPVLRLMKSLPLKGSEKPSHCHHHHHHHHKNKHCHGKKKHVVHQYIPGESSGKNVIVGIPSLPMKNPDDPSSYPSDMPSDDPSHNPDDDEEPCDGEEDEYDDDDEEDDEICDDEEKEEEEKYQREKEKEKNEEKHDQADSGRKHRHKRKITNNKGKFRSRGSGKHFSKKILSVKKY